MSTAFQKHGAFSWTELSTPDTAAARRFYGDLLGWKFEDMPMEHGGTYSVITIGEEKIGGIMAPPPGAGGMPPAWGTYVTVSAVDACAQKAQKLGGRIIVPPTDIPGVGRFSVIQDPQGAMISLITYSMPAA